MRGRGPPRIMNGLRPCASLLTLVAGFASIVAPACRSACDATPTTSRGAPSGGSAASSRSKSSSPLRGSQQTSDVGRVLTTEAQMVRWIEAVVSLEKVTPATVGRVFAVELFQVQSNPYWVFYTSVPSRPLVRVSFSHSRREPKWRVFWEYASAQAPHQNDLDLSPFGRTSRVDVNPDIPPEGTVTWEYRYRRHTLAIQFRARSRSVRVVALEPDVGEAAHEETN